MHLLNTAHKKPVERWAAFIFVAITAVTAFHIIPQIFPARLHSGDIEIRSVNDPNIRLEDYVVRKQDNSFLIASGAPGTIHLGFEFAEPGRYSAFVNERYPSWLCEPDQVNRATLAFTGGSLNTSFRLVAGREDVLDFDITRGQRLKFSLNNRSNPRCARANIRFEKHQSTVAISLIFSSILIALGLTVWSVGGSSISLALAALVSLTILTSEASLGTPGASSLWFALAASSILVGAISLFAVVRKWFVLPTYIVLLAVLFFASLPLLYVNTFGVVLSIEALHGAMQSYGSQIIEFWAEYFGYLNSFIALVAAIALFYLLNLAKRNTRTSWASASLGLLLIFLAAGWIALEWRSSLLLSLVERSVLEYTVELETFKKVAETRKKHALSAAVSEAHRDDTVVIVIGESVNKFHMSAYGYPRQTTPFADEKIREGSMLRFDNVYSNHTHSNPTMSLLLTQANQYNSKKWQESPSIFNLLSSAGRETVWLTNHRLLGGWSNSITAIAQEADRIQTVNNKIGKGLSSNSFDGAIIPLFAQALKQNLKKVFFLHFYNSHVGYCDRYPEQHLMPTHNWEPWVYGNLATLTRVDAFSLTCYDSSIKYTDSLLAEVVQKLEANENPAVLLYVADHSEEVLASRAHNSALYTYDMANVPLLIWANEAWRKKHASKWNTLRNNRRLVLTNDLMFEGFAELSGVESELIKSAYNPFSEDFESLKTPLSLWGRVKIDDHRNWNYWQAINFDHAIELGAIPVAIVRSLGEYLYAKNLGFTHFRLKIEDLNPPGQSKLIKALAESQKQNPILRFQASEEIKEIEISIVSDNELPQVPIWLPTFKEEMQLKTKNGATMFVTPVKTRYYHHTITATE